VKKPRGRPPIDTSGTPSAPLFVRLRASDFDDLERLARKQRESVSDLVRRGVTQILRSQRGEVRSV
jgi:hypothetical protein